MPSPRPCAEESPRTGQRLAPCYGFPHSLLDRTSKVKKGQPIELIGDVTHIDHERVTVKLGVPLTVNADTLRLVTVYKPPMRKAPLVDKPT
ncbi:hypothetical protein [Mesorhizobium sp.]|uniref:hypothetical protein n=1 Tax=Mesorhizobium sp. TaxID=1871066 RepID=UPI00345B49FA